MKSGIYLEDFKDIKSLIENFSIDENTLDNKEIILALYNQPSYEGYAFVLFKENGLFYEVNGSHCSCYGLEDQWLPELIGDEDRLKEYLKHLGNICYTDINAYELLFNNKDEIVLNFNDLDNYFAEVEYVKFGKKTTICLITTTFGMEISGVVHCQDANKYSFKLGREQAFNKAKDNAFPIILAYLKNV